MTSTANNGLDETIDGVRLDLQVFNSVWSSLRAYYEGTNITKTVATLLKMYQPEDGIQTYENLLKTLYVLLEDFDENRLRLLVSMVPLPKGSSDEDVKNVFFKATGFVRINAPIFQQSDLQQTSLTSPQDHCSSRASSLTDSDLPHRQKVHLSNCRFQGNPQMCLHPHVAPGYKMNWMPSPYLMQSENTIPTHSAYGDLIMKTANNKYVRVPATNMNQAGVHYYRPCQTVFPDRSTVADLNHTVTSNSLENMSSLPRSVVADYIESHKNIKMDISDQGKVSSEEKDEEMPLNDSENETTLSYSLEASKNLEACIDRFLMRAKNSPDFTADTNTKTPLQKRKNTVLQEKTGLSQQTVNMPPNPSEIAAYEKQYYENLINIQRAKAAAASSLSADCNPYQPDYFQHFLYQQQQQRMMMESQYAAQRYMQAELSYRPNDWMNHYPPARHPSTYEPCLMYPPQGYVPQNIYRSQLQSGIKRQKMDEAAEKLKENSLSDNNKTNNEN